MKRKIQKHLTVSPDVHKKIKAMAMSKGMVLERLAEQYILLGLKLETGK